MQELYSSRVYDMQVTSGSCTHPHVHCATPKDTAGHTEQVIILNLQPLHDCLAYTNTLEPCLSPQVPTCSTPNTRGRQSARHYPAQP